MGFVLSDRAVRRSAMDYWPRLKLKVHDDTDSFFAAVGSGKFWLFSTRGTRSFWDVSFSDGEWLVFGSETAGISQGILESHGARVLRIPQAPAERCINLSTSVGIALFEALRQLRGHSPA
jgi:tRNA (cytidine/uridine-2'-O-)-methyltransferase